jgi:hypothetical protein
VQLGWVLPLHETSETYLAGVVFMVQYRPIQPLGSDLIVSFLKQALAQAILLFAL